MAAFAYVISALRFVSPVNTSAAIHIRKILLFTFLQQRNRKSLKIILPKFGSTKNGYYFYCMIGKQIKQMRISKGMSKYGLAKLSKVKHDIVVKVEDDKSATLNTLKKLATALDAEIILQPKK